MRRRSARRCDRVDGRLKVTGGARYAAEFPVPDLAHAVLVQSTIASGRIARSTRPPPRRAPGVLGGHHPPQRAAAAAGSRRSAAGAASQTRVPLQDDRCYYNGQHVAVVVAETLEQAQHAASLVRVDVRQETPARVDLATRSADGLPAVAASSARRRDSRRGATPRRRWPAAESGSTRSTRRPIEHHNPMEPHRRPSPPGTATT